MKSNKARDDRPGLTRAPVMDADDDLSAPVEAEIARLDYSYVEGHTRHDHSRRRARGVD